MKMVKHNGRFGKMLKNGADICRRHIHSDSLYFCPGTSELFPERIKGVTPLAVANKNHRTCVHVQNHRQVPMPLENIPGYSQMSGNILNGHMFRQIQRIPFKSMAVRKPGIGKVELLLADLTATPTFKPLNLIIEKHPLRTNRNYPKSPGNRSPKNNVPAPTERTSKLPSSAFDGKDDRPSCVLGENIFIANQPKPVI